MIMPGVKLYSYQEEALGKMKNGCILNGGVGTGKSRTAIGYFYTLNGGQVNTDEYVIMKHPKDLYIITTARKRDTLEWNVDLAPFGMSSIQENNLYSNKVIVDSWNNIGKYSEIEGAFFIFDEQRVVGYGAWTKAFLKIAKQNEWILLSATPGDTWMDYIPVFIANGFYKNKAEFNRTHVIFSNYTNYPKVERYINTGRLIRQRKDILINMEMERPTTPHHIYVRVEYDDYLYNTITNVRWNIFKDKPIENASEFCLVLRRLVNSDISRQNAVLDVLKEHPKAIIFYSHDYELDILRELLKNYTFAEWNGHKHQPIPSGNAWAYLVEYTAGCEGWNCIVTDTIIFYSQNYSYKVMQQASGRIDRLNTPFKDLYYYHFKSMAKIDNTIELALRKKKKFNELGFAPKFEKEKTDGQC